MSRTGNDQSLRGYEVDYQGPKYYQVKQAIVSMINAEDIKVNEMIPSERELMNKYQISRITVRKAIDDLVHEGYLYKVQGKGTYVKGEDVKQNLFSLGSCTEEILRFGKTPHRRMLISKVAPADKIRIRRLSLVENDLVYELERVYLADDEPVNVTRTYLPYKYFPGIENHDFASESLYDVLQKVYDVKITRAVRSIEAILALDETAKLLEIKPGDPILLFRAVTYGIVNGREVPVENFKCSYRCDRYKFYIEQVTQ